MNKGRKIAGWVLTILAVIMPTWGVIGKLSNADMIEHMTRLGYGDWLTIIAMGECAGVVTFLIPKTMKIGTLLLTALLGGAIAAHIGHGESFGMQSTVLILVWIATFLRAPDFFKS